MSVVAVTGSTALTLTRTGVGSTATLSPDGRYRYDLTRRWRIGDDWLLWVMCNPSAADASVDDHTIRRVIGFSKREGFGGLAVVNLCAWRTPRPAELAHVGDPVGPDNQLHVARWVTRAWRVVAAWGAAEVAGGGSSLFVRWACEDAGKPLWCLGVTKHGSPRHPLRLAADTPLVEWPVRP